MTTTVSSFNAAIDSDSITSTELYNSVVKERAFWQTEEIRTQLVKLWMVTQKECYTEIDCQISTLSDRQALTFIVGEKRYGHFKSEELLKLLKFLEYISYKPASEDSFFDSIEGTRFTEFPCYDDKESGGYLKRILNYVFARK